MGREQREGCEQWCRNGGFGLKCVFLGGERWVVDCKGKEPGWLGGLGPWTEEFGLFLWVMERYNFLKIEI